MVASTEPTSFKAGDSLSWTRSLSDYKPEDGWTLTYHFANASSYVAVPCTDNGDSTHLCTLTAAITGALSVGEYGWQGIVTKGSEVITVLEGTVDVEQQFSAAYDARTFAAKMVDALETLLLSNASSEQTSVSVDGFSATFETKADLITAHGHWKQIYKQEQDAEAIAAGIGSPRSIRVRF